MTVSKLFRRLAGAAFAVVGTTMPMALAAQSPTQVVSTPVPTQQELARLSPLGNYLAARHAGAERDAASAAAYYRAALRTDPKNPELLDRAFLAELVEGNIDEAVKLADRLVHIDRNERVARLVLGVKAIKQKQYGAARRELGQSVRGQITDLAAALLSAWAQYGVGDSRSAVDTVDKLTGAEWYALFKDFHAGLILDLAKSKDAGKRLERAYKLDNNSIRVVDAYGSWLSRNHKQDEAIKVFQAFDQVLPRHPLVLQALDRLNKKESLPRIVDSAQAGAAEVLYGLGAALGHRGGQELGLVYLQLSLYLAPTQPLALLSLADLYETMKNPALAIKMYERVPQSSPLRRNADIQMAINLDSLDRTDEAKQRLEKLVANDSKDAEAIMALGNILRGRKQFAECASVYSKGIATIDKPERPNWLIFYFRGICNERAQHWDLAQADLQKALELFPDQPQVLNYLGYSWIDRDTNLDEGMRMIRRAVEQRPDDGYIVDSLGWAYYRTGNYDEAVKNLDRAVELKPEDPTINDHLGDAYWRVGRTLEAHFQWSHAKDLKPEPAELAKIETKLRTGLPEDTSSSANAGKAKKSDNGG